MTQAELDSLKKKKAKEEQEELDRRRRSNDYGYVPVYPFVSDYTPDTTSYTPEPGYTPDTTSYDTNCDGC